MPTLAGWLTGKQVPQEMIEQTLDAMSAVLGQRGGQPTRNISPGAGLVAFSDPAHAMQYNNEPPVLDWVPERRTLVYRRPLSGAHALYYIQDWPAQGNLLFASEIKALLAVGVPRHLSLPALDALLRYGFIPAPWTAFKDIFVVPAGSILRWQRSKTTVSPSTDFRFHNPRFSLENLDELHTLLTKTIRNLLPTHEQLVALTGGSNASTLTTLLAADQTTTSFSVASIDYKKDDAAWEDIEQIADSRQLPLLAITGVDQPAFWEAAIAGLEAPVADTRALALHQLLHTVSVETGARVAVSGLGGKMLLGTAIRSFTNAVPKQEALAPDAHILHQYSQMLLPQQEIPRLWSQEASSLLQQEEAWEESLHAHRLVRHATELPDKGVIWYYLDLHLRLPDYLVTPMLQLATQEQMVIRSPYLHSHSINTLADIPFMLEQEKPKEALLAGLVQRLSPERAHQPGTLPLTVPTASLRHIAGSELLEQTLSPDALKATGIFDPQAVQELLKRGDQTSVPRELIVVFTTQLLCRIFGVSLG